VAISLTRSTHIKHDQEVYSTAGTPESRHGHKKIVCSICGKDFESEETLNIHKKMEHNESSHAPAGVA
jgi:hypothetical protein